MCIYVIEKVVCDNPVPISLEAFSRLGKSPMALDAYLWANRRMSHLRGPGFVPWQLLYQQVDSYNVTKIYKQSFKKAIDRAREA
ncbi:hypothetical protein CI603_02225 [Bifidobacterium sp. wkB338]|nr:hypothetical protein CI603_02225 [Bifidobacterium sp. wkB338]